MNPNVTVLGTNGRIGQETAKAFLNAGWNVTGMARTDRSGIAKMRFVAGDALSPADVRKASEGAEIIVNCLNLPYDKWDKGRAEAQLQSVLDGLKGSGKTLLFPGNIYNYAASQHLIDPDTAQHPEKAKGEIRVRLEQMLAAATTSDNLQVIIVRSPDFYGPDATGTMFDLAMLTRIKSNVLQYPGPIDLGHSWAYLPDLGRVFVRVAEARASLPRFENFQFSGHFRTGHQMVAAISAVLPKNPKVTMLPWWMLRLVGLFVPVVREVVKMNYLWWAPHRLEDKKLDALLGPGFLTPFEEAVARTTRSYLPATEPQVQKVLAA